MRTIRTSLAILLARLLLGFIIGLVILSLASCKTTHKTRSKESTQSTLTTDSQSNVTTTTRQVSKTTINESIDTNVTLPGAKASISSPLAQILKGDTVRTQHDGTTLGLVFDTNSGMLHGFVDSQPKTIPIRKNRTTTIEAETNSHTKSQARHGVHMETTSEVSTSDKKKKSNPMVGVYVSIFVILLLVLLYLITRFRPRI
jgi:cobalamin biosynthesis Mg chelatase CobN